MAQYKRANYYGSGAVNGSLAYDFNNPELYPEYDEVIIPPRPEVGEEVLPDAGARSLPKTKQAVAPFAILGYACAAVMLVFALIAQITLSSVSMETVKMQNQLNELMLEETRLLIAYESAFNLTEIEEYAIVQLGMQKPRNDQIQYVKNNSPDRAEILTSDASSSGLSGKVNDTMELFRDFFKK